MFLRMLSLSAIEITGLLAFIYLSNVLSQPWVFEASVGITFCAVVLFIFLQQKIISKSSVLLFSFGSASITVLAYQLLGHTLLPGLVKGTAFFSSKNLVALVIVVALGTLLHIALVASARTLVRKRALE